ncbi:Modification methylase HhaI [subsurface metagenome]
MPTVIDLFAGAGGFGLGFQLSGYHLCFSLEIDRWATDTLRENNPNGVVLEDDITKYQSNQKIRGICSEVPDVIIGGPPCQGFSIAGPAEKDPEDTRNNLFKDFARWVECFEPKG